jgi:uncharacterized protein (DUF1499 family)
MGLVSVLAVTALITVVILSRVDDWGRDFSTNVAMTNESSKLKPLRLSLSVDEATEQLRRTIAAMPHWQWITDSRSEDGAVVVELVRSTALFRFKDDVQVKIAPDTSGPPDTTGTPNASGTGVVVSAISRSRVGKGDLGQNPRNIRELFERLVDAP